MSNFFDFNDAEEQREFGGEPIPGGTCALFKMSIRKPTKPENIVPTPAGLSPEDSAKHRMSTELVTKAKNSEFQYLDAVFECVSGTFKGRKMFQNLGVAGDPANDGHAKAVNITRATLKAMLQASRNIAQGDTSNPKLVIQGFHELDGIVVPLKLGYDKPTPGYPVRNCIRSVITPDKEPYAAIMAGGEILGNEPAPAVPSTANASPAGGWGASPAPASAAAPWGTPGAPPAAAAPATPPPSQAGLPGAAAPAWAR